MSDHDQHLTAIAKAANDDLDRLARHRAHATGETFHEAYKRVCEDNIEVTKRALGATPSVSDVEYESAVANNPLSKSLDDSLAAAKADDALMARAKRIQLERAHSGEAMNFAMALEVAKAERTAEG
jgi:hypothetical protein